MKITTKTGDKGMTGLFGGRRVVKSSPYIELLGQLDELQAMIGWCRHGEDEGEVPEKVKMVLDRLQDDIYRMMSIVGFEMKCPTNIREIDESDVEFLEAEMEKYQEVVGDLGKFIRPGSSETAARLNIARSVCRRVERIFVTIMEQELLIPEKILKYLNRLSDLLFVIGYSFEKKQ